MDRNRILIIALAAGCLGLGAWVWHLEGEVARLEHPVQVAQLQARVDTLVAEQADLQRRLDAAREDARAPAPAATPTPAAEPQKPDETRRLFANMKDFVKTPMVNEMIVGQQKIMLQNMYKGAAEHLNLTDEERKRFDEILLDRQMKLVNAGMEGMSGPTPERRAEIAKEIKQAQDTFKQDMDYFLNSEDDSTYFDHYEKTMSERMAMNNFAATQAQAGMPLAPDLVDQLVDTAYEVRKGYHFTTPLAQDNGQIPDPSVFSAENLAQHEKELADCNAAVASALQSYFTPEQLEQFKASQAQMLNMQVSSLKIAARMFGPDK